jgi:hypothetical protein
MHALLKNGPEIKLPKENKTQGHWLPVYIHSLSAA